MDIYGLPAYPAWQDIIFNTEGTALSALDTADVSLTLDAGSAFAQVVFEGRVTRRPDFSYLSLRLNELVAPYVRTAWPSGAVPDLPSGAGAEARQYGLNPDFARQFRLTWTDPADETVTADVDFVVYSDWSYETNPPALRALLRQEPIDGVLVPGQLLFFDGVPYGGMEVREIEEGQISGDSLLNVLKPGSRTNTPGSFYFDTNALLQEMTDTANEIVPYGLKTSLSSVTPEEIAGAPRYRFERACAARYVLYYLNALGGWDTFAVRGVVKESDTMTKAQYERQRDAITPGYSVVSPGRTVLQQQLRRRIEMHTHWLTDVQAAKMHHLTETVSLFVHDIQEGIIYAGIVTDTSHEYKTYRSNGYKLVSYTLNVELASDFERR